jgi:hypothetical protein
MNPVRFATLHGTLYLMPLSIWLSARLSLDQGGTEQVQGLFHQTVVLGLAAQIIGMALLFARSGPGSGAGRFAASLGILLFPLPLWTLSWLTASVEPNTLLKAMMLVTAGGVAAKALCRGISRLVSQSGFRNSLIGAAQLVLLMVFWHFRSFGLDWCGL